MDIKKLPADLRSKLQKLQNEVRHTLPRTIAVEAREHFVDNFRRGGFVNNGLRPWPEVKRRDPSSKWYGFEYHGDTRENSGKNKRLNYSPTATCRGILTSKRNYLMNSLQGMPGTGEAIITTAAPHAAIHNEGGTFKVFGKRNATMPKRQFVGQSKELDDKVEKMIINTMDKNYCCPVKLEYGTKTGLAPLRNQLIVFTLQLLHIKVIRHAQKYTFYRTAALLSAIKTHKQAKNQRNTQQGVFYVTKMKKNQRFKQQESRYAANDEGLVVFNDVIVEFEKDDIRHTS